LVETLNVWMKQIDVTGRKVMVPSSPTAEQTFVPVRIPDPGVPYYVNIFVTTWGRSVDVYISGEDSTATVAGVD